jgi:hypothetical protein
MENKYRNEMEIELAGEKILLRPTFENCAAIESSHGSLAWLGWKFSRGIRELKNMPGLTDVALLIYHMQAASDPDDANKKKYSLQEIWEKVQANGMTIPLMNKLIEFLARTTAGNKMANEPSENQKKS